MGIRIGWLFAFILFAFSATSQNIPGSVYGVFGFGDIRERGSSLTRAIGNTGIGVRDDYNINVVNPAALTSITRPVTSLFEIGANYGATSFNTSDASFSARSGTLTAVNYWFRFSSKWASNVGVAPFSNVSYNVLSTRVFGATNFPSAVLYQGSGGINQFYFGNAYDISKNFSVGANVSFYLGTVKKSEAVAATGISNQFEVDRVLSAEGANFDLGAQYKFSVKKTRVVLGATWDKGAHLTGTQQIAVVNPVTFDTLTKTDKLVLPTRLPPNLGFGMSIKTARSTFAGDVSWTEWKKATYDIPQEYRNSVKYSLGYEFRGEIGTYNYLKTISLRAGTWIQDYPIPIQNRFLTTWGYTLGVALPVQTNRATVSLNYSVTQLGTTQNGLVQEKSHKLSIDIIVRDVWGIRTKFD